MYKYGGATLPLYMSAVILKWSVNSRRRNFCPLMEDPKLEKFRNPRKQTLFSILSNNLGCRGTTDKFATIPFHLVLFSAALVELAKSIPVYSSILCSHFFFCLPGFLFPFIVSCKTVFVRPEDLET